MSVSKIIYSGFRVKIDAREAQATLLEILLSCGCDLARGELIAHHLVDSNLCGVVSHGVMRILRYVNQFRSGDMKLGTEPTISHNDGLFLVIDGQAGHGIPAMEFAYKWVPALHAAKVSVSRQS
jgi:LDH2 family malate/lactate/ureidoglycolate dehydrogenase